MPWPATEPDGKLGPVIDVRKHYYDVAGIEGLEWWVLTPILTLVLFVIILPLVLVGGEIARGRIGLFHCLLKRRRSSNSFSNFQRDFI